MIENNQNNLILNRIVNIIIAVVSLFLLIYTGYRAATLSFVFDESLSFNVYAQQDFMGIISYRVASANSHMINTLCLRYISLLFGTSEFLLRLPSLLSHLVYIIFSYKILRKESSPYILLAGFLLLNLNPFMLEFFSLARGYAMAISFTLVSIYFLFSYIENHDSKNIRWSFIFALFAVLSSYGLLIYYVSLIAIINIYWIASQNHIKFNDLIRKNLPVFICTVLLILILFEPIRKLIKYEEFYDGGLDGFWSDTVGSLIYTTLYEQSYLQIGLVYLKYFVAAASILLIMASAYRFYLRKKKIFTEKFTIAVLLLFFPCIVSIAQHLLINSLFLISRMALFFIPLFFLPVILFFSDSAKFRRWKFISLSFLFIMAGAFSIHTLYSLNTTHTYVWKYDADTKKMVSDLESEVKLYGKSPVRLGVMWLYEPTSSFYRKTKKYNWLEEVTEDDYRKTYYDYYYLPDSSMNFIKTRNLRIIKHYPTSNSYLVKQPPYNDR